MQINTYPLDLPHIEATLAHKMRTFGSQVDRTIVTVDVRPPQSGRYKGDPRADRYMSSLEQFRSLYPVLESKYENLSFHEVDYSETEKDAVSKYFLGSVEMPDKAWDGGPFYCYFQGILESDSDYVLHMDADMLFGGQSQTWVAESIALLQERDDLLFTSPLPGPPHPDGLKGKHVGADAAFDEVLVNGRPAYRFHFVSTRIFLMDMKRFKSSVGVLHLDTPPLTYRLRGVLLGNPIKALSAEQVLSLTLQKHGLGNMCFSGSGDGLYSLHPPYHFPAFHKALPELIARVERGDIPDGQLGDYDINDSLFDMSEARQNHAKHRRIKRRLKDLVTYWSARLKAS
ncbi:polysaccharide biosynthesis glycosyltransferase UppG [Roseibium sp. LAB1]